MLLGDITDKSIYSMPEARSAKTGATSRTRQPGTVISLERFSWPRVHDGEPHVRQGAAI